MHVDTQVLRRDPIAAGREEEVEETLQFASALVSDSAVNSVPSPDPPPSQSDPKVRFRVAGTTLAWVPKHRHNTRRVGSLFAQCEAEFASVGRYDAIV